MTFLSAFLSRRAKSPCSSHDMSSTGKLLFHPYFGQLFLILCLCVVWAGKKDENNIVIVGGGGDSGGGGGGGGGQSGMPLILITESGGKKKKGGGETILIIIPSKPTHHHHFVPMESSNSYPAPSKGSSGGSSYSPPAAPMHMPMQMPSYMQMPMTSMKGMTSGTPSYGTMMPDSGGATYEMADTLLSPSAIVSDDSMVSDESFASSGNIPVAVPYPVKWFRRSVHPHMTHQHQQRQHQSQPVRLIRLSDSVDEDRNVGESDEPTVLHL